MEKVWLFMGERYHGQGTERTRWEPGTPHRGAGPALDV